MEVTLNSPTTGKVRAIVSEYRPINGVEGYGEASFDAREREPTGSIFRVEDLAFDERSIGETSGF